MSVACLQATLAELAGRAGRHTEVITRNSIFDGIEPSVTRCTLLLAGLGAFIGGRLHFVAVHLTCSRTSRGTCCAFWSGLHAGGAIVGAVVALAIAPPRSGVPAWRLADAIVPGVGVGIAIARLGLLSARLLLRHSVRLTVVRHLPS